MKNAIIILCTLISIHSTGQSSSNQSNFSSSEVEKEFTFDNESSDQDVEIL